VADPRFYVNRGPFRLGDLAVVGEAELALPGTADLEISDVAPLDKAGSGDLSFLDNRRYVDVFAASRAGACVVATMFADHAPKGMALLVSSRPYRSYARIAAAFYPDEAAEPGVDAAARVAASVSVGSGVSIAAGAVVEAGAVLGDSVEIGPNAVVGRGVTIGAGTRIGAGGSLSHCDIGKRCLLHPGVRIGQRGFGFDMGSEGHLNVPQLGRVIVGDDVEIGANATIDRGAGPDTVIGDGCKIDNLVQIGHNVVLGRHCVVVAQAGIAGSARLEDFVILAGQSGVAGHLRVGAGTRLAARSGIMRDTEPGARLAGNPAIPAVEYFRQQATLAKIAKEAKKSAKE
jgi:UDP-3-O-[3-hydroxymyristoyl] glucosamine N-acyltransferase